MIDTDPARVVTICALMTLSSEAGFRFLRLSDGAIVALELLPADSGWESLLQNLELEREGMRFNVRLMAVSDFVVLTSRVFSNGGISHGRSLIVAAAAAWAYDGYPEQHVLWSTRYERIVSSFVAFRSGFDGDVDREVSATWALDHGHEMRTLNPRELEYVSSNVMEFRHLLLTLPEDFTVRAVADELVNALFERAGNCECGVCRLCRMYESAVRFREGL